MAKEYTVTWQIDLDADNPAEAANTARNMMREGGPFLDYFTVKLRGKRNTKTVGIDLATFTGEPPTEKQLQGVKIQGVKP